MALRLCKGKYIINNIDDIDYNYFDNQNNKFIILTKNDKIVAYMDSNHDIFYEFLNKSNIFEQGHFLLEKTKLEYVPVVEQNNIICFCYNDDYLDDALNKIKDLILFPSKNILSKYDNAIIYGYNELALYIEKLLKNNNLDYEIKDVLFSNNNIVKENDTTMKLYVEGNSGLSMKNYSYWKVFHEWLFDSIKPIYEIYNSLGIFNYDSDDYILEKIEKNEPFMMARIGNTELWIVKQYLQKKAGLLNNYDPFWLNFLFNTSGFFSSNNKIEDVDKFAIQHIDAIKKCDFNLCYGHEELAEGLNLVLNNLQNKKTYNYDWDKLSNPFDNKWFNSLNNKKILVISPYSKSIEQQAKMLNNLYGKQYPNIEIITYQCLETQLGNSNGYNSFFDALVKMENDIKILDFDIAFICSGAYGYLLASYIKDMGKSSIELCSFVPNWFGIKIKRYCTNFSVNKYWNDNWIFPLGNPIKNSEKIEDNCYWE